MPTSLLATDAAVPLALRFHAFNLPVPNYRMGLTFHLLARLSLPICLGSHILSPIHRHLLCVLSSRPLVATRVGSYTFPSLLSRLCCGVCCYAKYLIFIEESIKGVTATLYFTRKRGPFWLGGLAHCWVTHTAFQNSAKITLIFFWILIFTYRMVHRSSNFPDG